MVLRLCALQALGKHGIICIEDLVHEIHTCGPAFKQVKHLESSFHMFKFWQFGLLPERLVLDGKLPLC